MNNGLSSLDILAAILAYLSLHNFEESRQQSKKLDIIINDMEKKLEYQDELLKTILERVDEIKNGK